MGVLAAVYHQLQRLRKLLALTAVGGGLFFAAAWVLRDVGRVKNELQRLLTARLEAQDRYVFQLLC